MADPISVHGDLKVVGDITADNLGGTPIPPQDLYTKAEVDAIVANAVQNLYTSEQVSTMISQALADFKSTLYVV